MKEATFENNSYPYTLYPLARRNIICQGGGKVTMQSLKVGDVEEKGTSLWVEPSSECEFGGITEDRDSLFFIPTLINITNTTDGNAYFFTFNGTLFLPCSLTPSLVFVGESRDVVPLSEMEYVNETVMSGSVGKTKVDGVGKKVSVVGCVFYVGKDGGRKNTSMFSLKNGMEEKT
jgi:hypothetical protein